MATYPAGPVPTVPTSSMAIVSLVTGILAYVALPFLGAIAAIITGHMAKGDIQRSQGQLGGDGLALAGLILGYSQLVLGCLAVGALLAFFGFGVSVLESLSRS